jgi:aminoglycoside phosphotransferase (APT) family kinase protein
MSQHDLDPVAILAALDVTDGTEIVPVQGGQDTAIWRVDTGGKRCALRLFRAGEERKCRREVASMRAAAAGGIPVPIVHAEGMWEGRPALLLSWMAGRTMVGAFREQPWRITAFGAMCGRMQARIHAIPAPEGPEYPPDRWLDWAGPLDAPLRERLLALARHPLAFCHFDYHPLNAMTDGKQITAILDWPNALPGDPRADLARTFVLLRFPPNTRLRPHEALAVRLFLSGWWRAYQRAAGPVTDMALFYVWAGTITVLDQEGKLDRPNIPRRSDSFDPLRRWTAQWRQRAGLPPVG